MACKCDAFHGSMAASLFVSMDGAGSDVAPGESQQVHSIKEAPMNRRAGLMVADQRWGLAAWCVIAAFGTYFCMYAFRKPFTAAGFADYEWWGIGYKTLLVTAQVLGYTLSKFIGIKVIAEMNPARRAAAILLLIGIAETALLAFALVRPPFHLICLFFNGLPLGMVFGLVLGFLEGRQLTEALSAGLCASFIVADGVVKSVGAYLLVLGVSEFWMPFAAGAVFVPPLLVFVWMLARIPPPAPVDVSHRGQREPMDRADRRRFFRRYAVGLSLLLLVYLAVTILRSIRADFAPEIWTCLGHGGQPSVFATSEMAVAMLVMLVNGLCVLIIDNRRAFFASLAISLGGIALLAVALAAFAGGWISGFPFMILVGLGLYLPYVAVHTTIFERLIAMTRDRGNIGYLMYLADAFGYLGYVVLMLGKSRLSLEGDFMAFFTRVSWVTAAAAAGMLLAAWCYFAVRRREDNQEKPADETVGAKFNLVLPAEESG
jgi:hypothetical protein